MVYHSNIEMRVSRYSMIAAALLCGAGCSLELEHGLDERQANQVATLLESAGIAADKSIEDGAGNTFKITVPRADAPRAFALIESHDLPRRGQKGLAETFSGGGILPSAVEERARLGAALSAELEHTLEGLPGVTAARVHLALPEVDALSGEGARPRPTASVLLKSTTPLPIADSDVKKLVAGAVNGLQAADVSVVMANVPAAEAPMAFDHVGPVRVAHESRGTLAAFATSTLALILVLSLVVILCALRIGTLRKKVRDLERA
jgi:type III secretion protein J